MTADRKFRAAVSPQLQGIPDFIQGYHQKEVDVGFLLFSLS